MLDAAAVRQSWRNWWSFSIHSTGPVWLQVLWTILFNTAFALLLTLLVWVFGKPPDLLRLLTQNFVIAQSIGLTIHALFEAGAQVIGHGRVEAFATPARLLFYIGIPVVGVLIGYGIGLTLLGVDPIRIVQETPRVVMAVLFFALILAIFFYAHMRNNTRLALAEAERERERAKVVELQRQAINAQLTALQAQIEPHFLFNTLANVVSLIESAPGNARLMLERLIELLRATLNGSRGERTTLGQEARLVAAYCEILQIRMGSRLSYVIDIPPDLADARIPPLSLQPLVENSIRHGLEPKAEGGTVRISARVAAGALQVDVEDDGFGFSDQPGAGVGLANLRDRIAALYSGKGRVAVQELAPGTRVRMTIPLARIQQA